jgi:hypothetical protein
MLLWLLSDNEIAYCSFKLHHVTAKLHRRVIITKEKSKKGLLRKLGEVLTISADIMFYASLPSK